MPNYTYARITDATTALGARLYDTGFQQWTQAELQLYLTEALRTWNALSGFWRAEMVFPLSQGNWWYDLRTVAGTLIPYTVTKYDLITQIENHLLEPPTPIAWSGSNQFTLVDVVNSLERRQNDTLGATACTVVKSLVIAPIVKRVVLADNTIDIRRVAFLPTAGFGVSNRILSQSDVFAARAFNAGFTVQPEQPPTTWMQNTEPPPSFDVDSVPPVGGQYEVLTVQAGPTWAAGANGTLNIPDDWTWVFKWGALMDLLGHESNAQDALRAEYCRRRFQEGLALLEMMPTLLELRVNNIPLTVSAVRNGDRFNAGWQAAAQGPPKSAYLTANLLGISPAPDAGAYSITATVAENAPLDATYVQVARDDFPAVLDYAQHLAMFKQGGEEFAKSVALYQNFQKKAAQYNAKLKEMGFFLMDQQDLGTEEERFNSRFGASNPLALS